jgi:hypothetical protein
MILILNNLKTSNMEAKESYFCINRKGTVNMKKKGKNLIFISSISRDGKGVNMFENTDMSHLDNEEFTLKRLSITNKTYIAFNMTVFIVKIKP